MRRLIVALLIISIALNLAGCEALRKKFTRKKKEPVKMPRIYQLKKYEKQPTPELYKKHYAYWASWQSELIKVLGENKLKDRKCIEQIVSNLQDMQNILAPEKAAELEPHITKLSAVKDIIFNEELTIANKDYVRRTLEREERIIKREFVFSKLKEGLRKSFDE